MQNARTRAGQPVQRLLRVALGLAAVAGTVGLVSSINIPQAWAVNRPSIGASVTDVTPTSVVVNVDYSKGSLHGACYATVSANLSSVGDTPSFQNETPKTRKPAGEGRRESYRIEGLLPNSRYAVSAKVIVTGATEFPCLDVGQTTTPVQEFTTPREVIPYHWSTGSTTNGKGNFELRVEGKPTPHGTSTIYVQYGATTAYGTASKPASCLAGLGKCTATLDFPPNPTVLKPNAPYHFRAVIENNLNGRAESPDDIFIAPDVCKRPPSDGAIFTDCDLKSVDWSGKNVRDVVLNGATMNDANLSGLELYKGKMVRTILIGADLQKAMLYALDAPGVSLNSAKLNGADLFGPASVGANLSHAKLIDAKATKIDLRGANLQDAFMQGAILVNANLRHADLKGADLSGADLDGAKLEGATIDRSTKLPPSIAKAYCGHTMWDGQERNGLGCPPPRD